MLKYVPTCLCVMCVNLVCVHVSVCDGCMCLHLCVTSAGACVGLYGHQKMMFVLPECFSVYHMCTVITEERRGL